MREQLRTYIKVPVRLVLLFLSMPLISHASAPEYHLGFENWLSRDTVTPSYFPILDAGIAAEDTEYKVDARFRVSPSHLKAFAFTGANVYLSPTSDGPIRFSLGRRLVGWSKLDEMWALGEFEPLDSWDRLRSSPQGLTGIFADFESSAVNVHFFASYLFLPETTPNVIIENDKFVLNHPQSVSTAPQTYPILRLPTPIGYNLVIPNLKDIVLRPSVALQVETSFPSPFKAKVAYGYLPLNYFPVAMKGIYDVIPGQIFVELHPRLLHHHLINGEIAYRFSDSFSSGFVALLERPVSDTIPADYTTSTLTDSGTYSPWIQYEMPSIRLQFAYLRTFDGLGRDVGPDADTDPNSSTSIFSSRILYRNATQFKARYQFSPGHLDSAYVEGKYTHDYSIKADWIAADFVFYAQKNLSFLIGGDLINSEKTVSAERGAEFLADVRAIDRLRLGVQYVF